MLGIGSASGPDRKKSTLDYQIARFEIPCYKNYNKIFLQKDSQSAPNHKEVVQYKALNFQNQHGHHFIQSRFVFTGSTQEGGQRTWSPTPEGGGWNPPPDPSRRGRLINVRLPNMGVDVPVTIIISSAQSCEPLDRAACPIDLQRSFEHSRFRSVNRLHPRSFHRSWVPDTRRQAGEFPAPSNHKW